MNINEHFKKAQALRPQIEQLLADINKAKKLDDQSCWAFCQRAMALGLVDFQGIAHSHMLKERIPPVRVGISVISVEDRIRRFSEQPDFYSTEMTKNHIINQAQRILNILDNHENSYLPCTKPPYGINAAYSDFKFLIP
jgi:hypothetical protein